MSDKSNELTFQNDMINHLVKGGWKIGKPEHYNRELALYSEDLVSYVKETQAKQWEKLAKSFPNNTEEKLLERVVMQQKKADTHAAHSTLRTYGTLGVLRNPVSVNGTRFNLCQFKPENTLNAETLANYQKNIFRVVPELVYSPWATKEAYDASGKTAKKWRIDLVLFVNGLPIATLELKSEFKQAVQNAIKQYKLTRPPVDPVVKKPEPLLTFKRGALVHFAVSQYEVYMTTKLEGADSFFLPFNKGTADGGAGNDVPEDVNEYATGYLWNEVLHPDNLLKILAKFIHLEIKDGEEWNGKKTRKETMIFPRYHQWDVVNSLVDAAKEEGPGNKYLIQHSAGSGKSNSIAWTAHQLSALTDEQGDKRFNSVIIVTDRTVLDSQLQDTVSQFERTDGVVSRINREEGDGSKSEKLATALECSQAIIIVTIQTFPHVLKAIENNANLKERNYAIIADEAHSSQTGSTARKLKEVLQLDKGDEEKELTAEDILDNLIASRRAASNLSYFAFTATPKAKTLELFGTLPRPEEAPSKINKPEPFHIYSMRQAIEEGFILDVLKNYTNYKVAYKLSLKIQAQDSEVDSKKARVKLNQWVKLHDYNISQKVKVIVEHFKDNIHGLLGGQAKAMLVTGSRKEAVRYKLALDKYIQDQGYANLYGMVAFSGEVTFDDSDPDSAALVGQKFTETSMNPNLNGRDMPLAFDTDDYQIMIVANKFQTGFDQPKLCAMYVDKKLGGVECVQTLSRLNRTYPGKAESGTFVLDFFNEPEDIQRAFEPYYKTAELFDVSDPDLIHDLLEKLNSVGIYEWHEVEAFCVAFYEKSKSSAAISNICKPAVERWKVRYNLALQEYKKTKEELDLTKATKQETLIANAEKRFKEAKKIKDQLDIFKKDLGTFIRFYEFMSQIVDYDSKDLEKLALFARKLRPLLREYIEEVDPIDLTNVEMNKYRLSMIRKQSIILGENDEDHRLRGSDGLGSAAPRDKKEEMLSAILDALNEIFITNDLSDVDMLNYVYTVRDKVKENSQVMHQVNNNSEEQAKLGTFPEAVGEAILDSSEVHQNLKIQLLSDPAKHRRFEELIFKLLKFAS